ncbi:MAG TPA: TPM domain-containing protein [Caldimonas sp.]|jgi:uncharacterized protein
MRGWLALAALVAAFALGSAEAEPVVPVPLLSARVIDQTATLTPPQAAALSAKLEAIEKQHGAQLVILIVPTARPEDIASFAQRVAADWKLGRKEVGDGLLLTVAKDDHDVNIQVAATLEGAVPDVVAGRIIREQILPAFRNGDYAGGLNAGIDSIAALVAGEKLPPPSARPAAGTRPSARRGFDWQDLAIFLFVGVPIVGRLLGSVLGRKLGALATGAAVGAVGWWLTASLLLGIGAGAVALFLVGVMGMGGGRGGFGGPMIWGGGLGGGFGGGGFGGGGGGGGGFSSGGGGSFDGGGASGRW